MAHVKLGCNIKLYMLVMPPLKAVFSGLAAGLGVGALAESLRRSMGASDGKIVAFQIVLYVFLTS